MFPMRDHLYELAKAQEIELLARVRHEQMLEQTRNHNYQVWTLDTIRKLWQKLFRRTMRTPRINGPTHSRPANRLNVIEG